MSEQIPPLGYVILALILIILVLLFFFWRKGRPFTSGDVFQASRWSSGNHLFPTQVAITPQSVVHYTPRWLGKLEHSIHMAHVASVRIITRLFFADVHIETTGGHNPIRCHGHTKGDAVQMKELIERYQSDYYRAGQNPAGAAAAGPVGPPATRR